MAQQTRYRSMSAVLRRAKRHCVDVQQFVAVSSSDIERVSRAHSNIISESATPSIRKFCCSAIKTPKEHLQIFLRNPHCSFDCHRFGNQVTSLIKSALPQSDRNQLIEAAQCPAVTVFTLRKVNVKNRAVALGVGLISRNN